MEVKTKARVQLGLIVVLVIFALSLFLSQSAGPNNPPLFFLKRVQEKAFLKFQSTPENKVKYMSSLLNIRLAELQSVVNSKDYGYVLLSSLRYSTLAGQITELIVANNLTNQASVVKEQFLKHQKSLDDLYVLYPKNIPDNEEWKYIQDDFNYLGLYLDQLSKIK